ncbi:hypothetical protein OG533_38585 [Streptomyces sp. NBC_01186]|nr:hypothetical protein OG533_38585 [Streptomyces sp. NBC_01186]
MADLTVERQRIDRMIDGLLRSRDLLDDAIDTAAGRPPRAARHGEDAP